MNKKIKKIKIAGRVWYRNIETGELLSPLQIKLLMNKEDI